MRCFDAAVTLSAGTVRAVDENVIILGHVSCVATLQKHASKCANVEIEVHATKLAAFPFVDRHNKCISFPLLAHITLVIVKVLGNSYN